MRFIFLITFLLSNVPAWSQPCFKAYDQASLEISTFCVNQEVTFRDCNNTAPDDQEYYIFNYKSGAPLTGETLTKQHTYTAPGRYRVLQIANYGGATLTDTVSRVFEVKAAPTPTFEVTRCAQNKIRVRITDTTYDSYLVDLGQGQRQAVLPGSITEFPYSNTVTVTGQYTGASCSSPPAPQPVAPLPAAPVPVIASLTVLQQANSGEIRFELENLQPGYGYQIEQLQGQTYSPLASIPAVSQATLTYSLPNVNTSTSNTYRVRPTDACETNLPPSSPLGSIVLAALSGNEQVQLQWQGAGSFSRYEVYRNNNLIQTLSTTQYTDKEVNCGQNIVYDVKGIGAAGRTSNAAPQQVQVTSTRIPPAPLLLASFDLQNNVVLTLQLPLGEELQQIALQRSLQGNSYLPLATTRQAQYQDKLSPIAPACYRATFTNTCNSTSPLSNVTCPVILEGQKLDDGSVTLSWTSFTGFPTGAGTYTVELLDDHNSLVGTWPATGTSFTEPNPTTTLQVLRYRIKATSADNTYTTYSNLLLIEQRLQLHVPSAFTPNGDGLNDTFEVKGKLFSTFRITVYNHLGQVVFTSSDVTAGWDGTYAGKQMPAGAYAYIIEVQTIDGTPKRRTGTVTLLR